MWNSCSSGAWAIRKRGWGSERHAMRHILDDSFVPARILGLGVVLPPRARWNLDAWRMLCVGRQC